MRLPSIDTALAARILDRWRIGALPTAPTRRLELLHAACLRQVPFENLTKLVHRRAAPRLEAARRQPAIFWQEHLEMGSGGTCFATTAGFGSLLGAVELLARPVFCHLPAERRQAHVALIVETESGPWLSDTGYALAGPIPLPGRSPVRRRTRHYDMELRQGVDGDYLLFIEDGRGRRFRYQFRDQPIAAGDWTSAWNDSLKSDAIYMNRLALGRFGASVRWILHPDHRVMVLSRGGERAMVLPPEEAAANRRLARLFRLPESLLVAGRQALRERLAHRRKSMVDVSRDESSAA